MAVRVKLCAIAKNEGPYLADWVFHHLYFGFDGVEVWVNGSNDGSLRILKVIGSTHPQVTRRNADRLLAECLASGEVFQHQAYARMARRARRQGYTHVAFLDLDEYWTPNDCTTGIKAFVPEDPDVNVISFQWALDVPDPTRPPFAPPLSGEQRVQLDRHVKTVARLDGSVKQFLTHTARTRAGVRLLVREPFPLVKRTGQRGGSLLPEQFLVEHWGTLPDAFVLHAVNRSPREYVASLTKGQRMAGKDLDIKARRGYLPTEAPVLELAPTARARRAYERERRTFHRTVKVERLVRRAEALAVARADGLLASAASDEAVMAQLDGSLRGLS
jgi:hypothetical protein